MDGIKGDAPFCRLIIATLAVQENGRSCPPDWRVIIVTQYQDDVVQPVFAPQGLMGGRIGAPDRSVVGCVVGRVAPAVIRTERSDR